MKPVFWLQFLKETIPDNRTRRQLQRHLNQHLITRRNPFVNQVVGVLKRN